MKNNKFINVLLIVVVVLIYTKVFLKMKGDTDTNATAVQVIQTSNNASQFLVKKEKFELTFNQKDPFEFSQTSKYRDSKVNILNNNVKVKTLAAEHNEQIYAPIINWPKIEYFGFVQSNKNKDKLTILKVSNTLIYLREGESFFKQYQLLKAYKDSVVISNEGALKIIQLIN